MQNVIYRSITKEDEIFLWEILFQAAHMASSETIESAKKHPILSRYVKDFGEEQTDIGYLAIDEISNVKIGAAWVRLLTGDRKGYSYIDNSTPELAMAVTPNYRNKGIGSNLLNLVIQKAKNQFNSIGLSVRDTNPAFKLYKRFNFCTIKNGSIPNRVGGTSYLMKLKL